MKTKLNLSVFLIAELFVFLPTYAQEYESAKTKLVEMIETSKDSINWYWLYESSGEDLRIANTIKVESTEDYEFLKLILGEIRARLVMSIYYTYWRAYNEDGILIMSGTGRGKKYR